MQIISIEDKKFIIVGKVLLDHFKSDADREKYLAGTIRIMQKNNPNECLIAQEILDAKFEDIKEEGGNNGSMTGEEIEANTEEIPKPQAPPPFMHTFNIKMGG